jgi:hypothetical protein
MTKTRNNHYVPRWYQEGFFEPGRNTYSYLDLMKIDPKEEAGFMEMMKEDYKREMLRWPREALRRQVLRASPELDQEAVEAALEGFDVLR